MIKSTTVQTLGEVKEILENLDKEQREENKTIKSTIDALKNYVNTKPEKIKLLKSEIEKLNILKLNSKHISKIVDLMPEDAEDLRKIFVGEDFNLDQDEINSILETVKKHV